MDYDDMCGFKEVQPDCQFPGSEGLTRLVLFWSSSPHESGGPCPLTCFDHVEKLVNRFWILDNSQPLQGKQDLRTICLLLEGERHRFSM